MKDVRADFPLLSGRCVSYLDSAATSQKPRQVLEAMRRFYEESNANVHRGVYALAEEASEALEGARREVAGFIGAPDPASVVFTRGTTESINLVAQGWAARRLKPGDEIAVTDLEHHSNLLTWQRRLDVRALGCDFLAFSGHKMLGPTGIGVLWGKRERLEETEPLLLGGGMVREVLADRATYLDAPAKFEAGTPAVAEAVGLRAALQ